MAFNYKFANLAGAIYKRGNVVFSPDGTSVLSPVGNRVTVFDLKRHNSRTLPFENRKDIACIALSPNGRTLVSVDVDGRALIVNLFKGTTVSTLKFKRKTRCVTFSPCGGFIAAGVGPTVELWSAPPVAASYAPCRRIRVFASHTGDVTHIEWSPDSQFFATCAKDYLVRIFSRSGIRGFRAHHLSGHRGRPVSVFFGHDGHLYTVAKDGGLFVWKVDPDESAPARVQERASLGRRRRGELSADEDDAANTTKRRRTVAGPVRLAPDASGALVARDSDSELPDAAGALQVEDDAAASGAESAEDADGSSSDSDSAGDSDSSSGTSSGSSSADDAEGLGRWHGPGLDAADEDDAPTALPLLARCSIRCAKKHFLWEAGKKVAVARLHRSQSSDLLVVGFESGVFALYELPTFQMIHSLSVSSHRITACAISPSGEWLALGSAQLGQLLVWEWQSETYVLKLQGHGATDIHTLAFSPDSQLVATGAGDGKVKLWNAHSGFGFVTFADHSAPVTAVIFANPTVVLSASLDGSVRAYDLTRYRNFRTMTANTPTQFTSLAVDPSGEVIVAGARDPFNIYVWSLRTGRLLDVLSGHEGPITGLAFAGSQSMLASSSWDKTVRLWDVFESKGGVETFEHSSDVLAVAWRPDGKQLCSASLDGNLYVWDIESGQLTHTLDGKFDIVGGRMKNDERAAGNSTEGRAFTSVCYSADGRDVLAGGKSKFVCLYDVNERILLRKFQISKNRSLQGITDQLNSRHVTASGVVRDSDDERSDTDSDPESTNFSPLPGVLGGDFAEHNAAKRGQRTTARAALTRCVRFAPHGRTWAAASTEGLLMYSLDEDMFFDPIELEMDATPDNITRALAERQWGQALLMAAQLNERALLETVLFATPHAAVDLVVRRLPMQFLNRVLVALAEALPRVTQLGLVLAWVTTVLKVHGRRMKQEQHLWHASLRALSQQLTERFDVVKTLTESNLARLDMLTVQCRPATATGGPGQLRTTFAEDPREVEARAKKDAQAAARTPFAVAARDDAADGGLAGAV